MSKLAILADPHSTHTFKWVKNLSEKGYEVLLIGISDRDTLIYKELPNVEFVLFKVIKNIQHK